MKLKSEKPKHTAREIRLKGIITQASLFWTTLSLIKKLAILTGITLLGGILGLLTGAPLLGLIGGLGFFLLIHAISTYLFHSKIDKTKCPINESQISSELLDEAQQSSEELILANEELIDFYDEQEISDKNTFELQQTSSQVTVMNLLRGSVQENIPVSQEIDQNNPEQFNSLNQHKICSPKLVEEPDQEASNTVLELKNAFNAVLKELNQSAQKPVHQQHVHAHNTTHATLTKNHEEELNIIQPHEAEIIQNKINTIQYQQDDLEAKMDKLLSKLLLENKQLEEYANHETARTNSQY